MDTMVRMDSMKTFDSLDLIYIIDTPDPMYILETMDCMDTFDSVDIKYTIDTMDPMYNLETVQKLCDVPSQSNSCRQQLTHGQEYSQEIGRFSYTPCGGDVTKTKSLKKKDL